MSPEEEARKALNQINNHENELRELKSDIRALAAIEHYHAAGAVVPKQAPGQPLTPDQLNEYNAAVSRLNSRYSRNRP